jgi:hypothetical protein
MDIDKLVNSKNKILSILIVLVSLFIGYKVYVREAAKIKELKQEKELELNKNRVLTSIIALENKVNSYKNVVNNKDVSAIMNKLFAIANEAKVKINAIRPSASRDFPQYAKFPFKLSVSANNFNRIGKFISNLESSRDIYILESLVVATDGTQANFSATKADNLTLTLTLSTVLLK